MAFDTVVSGGSVVIPGQGIQSVDLAIQGEQVAAILPRGASVEAGTTIDATGLYVLPGALDTHVHWGGADECLSDSRAAAISGTTTAILLQPHFSDSEEATLIDFISNPVIGDAEALDSVEESIEQKGSPSFKFFMAYRNIPGVPPGDVSFSDLTDGVMVEAMQRMGKYDGTLACVHAENPEIINWATAQALTKRSDGDGLRAWEEGNPGLAEAEAIQRSTFFAEQADVPIYIPHVSGRDALTALRRAKGHWPKTYGETCPHYLFYNVDIAPNGLKFSPPLRYQEDTEALWEALATGAMDCIGSDNSTGLAPQRSDKQGNIWDIPRGGPGSGILLQLILSEGVNKGRLTLERAVEVTSTNAARIFGLYPKKGTIQVGSDADLAIVDMNLEKAVSPELLQLTSDYTFYDGVTFKGWPVVTMLRGRVIVEQGEPKVGPGYGQFIPRWATRR